MTIRRVQASTPEEATMRKDRILLVDDDPHIVTGVGKDLEHEGFEVTTAASAATAIELLDTASFDLVITDLVMEPLDGIDVLKKAKQINAETMVMVLTGYGDMASAIEALRLDADDYVLKPCEPDEMHFRVSRCLEKLALRRKLKAYETILPVCCVCKKIRDDSNREPGTGEWMSVEKYLWMKAGLSSSSTYCPECAERATEQMKQEMP
jgi:DNA-binding response OmpR family regulator